MGVLMDIAESVLDTRSPTVMTPGAMLPLFSAVPADPSVPSQDTPLRVWLQTSLHLGQGSTVGGYKSIRRLQLEKLSKLNPHSRSFSGIRVG